MYTFKYFFLVKKKCIFISDISLLLPFSYPDQVLEVFQKSARQATKFIAYSQFQKIKNSNIIIL